MSIWKRYGFAWVTGFLFLFSLVGHWLFGWFAYADEQRTLGQAVSVSGYTVEMLRDTFENWQSEFLQLIWQVVGLTYLLYVGSPQSQEEDDRLELKIDEILKRVAPADGEAVIADLDRRHPGRFAGPDF